MALSQIEVIRQALNPMSPEILQSSQVILVDGEDRSEHFGAGCSCIHDANSAFSSGTFPVEIPFDLGPGFHTIEWRCGWNVSPSELRGNAQYLAFKGEVIGHSQQYYRRADTLQAGGALKRTEEGLDLGIAFYNTAAPFPDDMAEQVDAAGPEYQPVPIDTDASIIVKILEMYGITSATWYHNIVASEYQRAMYSPILWSPGQPGWAIISELDRISTYRTFDGRTGAVYRRKVQGKVPASVKHTFQQGIDILDLQPSRTFIVFNQVVVTGASFSTIEDDPETDEDESIVQGIAPPGTPTPSVYIPNPPGVRTDRTISSEYIETTEDAASLAEERLAIVRQPLMTLPLTTFGLSDVDVGDALALDADALNIQTNAYVVRHSLNGEPYRSQIDLVGSTEAEIRDPATEGDLPIPGMIITTVLEHVLVAGVSTAVVMITVDASSSSDPDGTIESIVIVIDGVTYPGPVATHLTSSPSPVAVSVTVTDNDGHVVAMPGVATWAPAALVQEPVTTAELNQAAGTRDGETTWQEQAGPYISVAPIALGNGTLYGRSNGDVDRSVDYLTTLPVLAHSFPAAVNRLWNNEKTITRWLAGLENGEVWVSADDGVTWLLFGSPAAAPIVDLSESPDAPGSVTVACGTSVYHTFDGVTWEALITGTSACLRFCAAGYDGLSRVYAGFADGSVWRKPDGMDATLLFTASPAAAIRGLTSAIASEELYAFTDTTKTYIWDQGAGVRAGPDTGSATNHAIRSGAGKWVLVATDAALQKWLPGSMQAHDIRLMTAPDRCLQVGYGKAGKIVAAPPIPPPPGAVEWVALDSSPGKLWHFDPVAGTLTNKIGNLPPTVVWRRIAIDPLAPDRWMVMSTGFGMKPNDAKVYATVGSTVTSASCLWMTQNAGASWQPVTLAPTGVSHGFGRIGFNPFIADHGYLQWLAHTGNVVGPSISGILYGSTADNDTAEGWNQEQLGGGDRWQAKMGMWDADKRTGDLLMFVNDWDPDPDIRRFLTVHYYDTYDFTADVDPVAPDVGLPVYLQISHTSDEWIAYYYTPGSSAGFIARSNFRGPYSDMHVSGGRAIQCKSEPIWFNSTDLYYHPTPSGSILQKIPGYSSSNLEAVAVPVDVGVASPGGILLVADKISRSRMVYSTNKGVFTFDGTTWGKSTYAAGSGAKFRSEYNAWDVIKRP